MRRKDNTSNAGMSLLKIYSRPSHQFSGYGEIEENFAVFHQSLMSKCRTLQICEEETVENLHVLFSPNGPAVIFYHKHVQAKTRNLDDAFHMLYARFLSLERRDRLIFEWNNLKFETFCKEPGESKHGALKDLCKKRPCYSYSLDHLIKMNNTCLMP